MEIITSVTSRSRRSRFAGQAWFVLYLALAALDLGAVSYTLYQHYHVTLLLETRANLDEAFDKQDRVIHQLGALATEIDAVANGVEESRDAPTSRTKLNAMKGEVPKVLASLRLSVETTPRRSKRMVETVDSIENEMAYITSAGDAKLEAIERGDLAGAVKENARLDTGQFNVERMLNDLATLVDGIQDQLFAEEHAEVRLIHRAQILIASLILLVIAGMAFYGRALAQQVLSARERERYVDELRASNAAFEQLFRKNELILNTAADGIFGLDLDCKLTFLNPAAAAMIGFSFEELGGRSIHDAVHHTHADGTPYPADLCPGHRALQEGEAVNVLDDTYWRKDGTSFSVEYSITPMLSDEGDILGAVVTFRDTTERRALQRLKDEFVSTVSHELRTPLTSIRGALGLLAAGLQAKSPEKAQRMLDIAVSNTDRLVRLINDILDIERIDSARVTLTKTRCEPALLLRDSVDLMRPMADKARIRIDLAPIEASPVWVDADRITQTITNLLSNAIKFSPAESIISVSARHGREGIVFRVSDQGRGIPSDKLDSIFERFQQVDASDSRDRGGSGLGLTICRSIVRQHGGELRVESIVGEGSTFSFSLPSASVQQDSATPAAGARVIVCDDDPSVRETLEAMLQQHGYNVLTVDGGQELLRQVRSFRPDVILLDLFMPVMGGWHAMAALRNDQETAAIPVVILSGLSKDEAPAPFDLAGWLSKPLDEGTLIDTLEHALGLGGRNARIMMAEDDFDLARVIIASFESHGIEACHVATGREAIAAMREQAPDVLILDLGLPEIDGFGVVEWMRTQEQLSHVPLMVYSAGDPTASDRERLKLGPTQFLVKSRVAPDDFERRVVKLLDVLTLPKKEVSHAA
ncbi:MAG TPA: response regulator [Thermoanaerobaculia bacterium]|jgi:PAS domain S-box-containing protein|nr:response regulator [Thermoanaerobaculia bacterium]